MALHHILVYNSIHVSHSAEFRATNQLNFNMFMYVCTSIKFQFISIRQQTDSVVVATKITEQKKRNSLHKRLLIVFVGSICYGFMQSNFFSWICGDCENMVIPFELLIDMDWQMNIFCCENYVLTQKYEKNCDNCN